MSNQIFAVPLGRLVVAMTIKDPDATLCYSLDWTEWLKRCDAGDSIESVDWDIPAGLDEVSGSDETSEAISKITLSGGTAGETYDVTCTVTTVNGIIDQRVLKIKVENP